MLFPVFGQWHLYVLQMFGNEAQTSGFSVYGEDESIFTCWQSEVKGPQGIHS